jgi:hypothetical protein
MSRTFPLLFIISAMRLAILSLINVTWAPPLWWFIESERVNYRENHAFSDTNFTCSCGCYWWKILAETYFRSTILLQHSIFLLCVSTESNIYIDTYNTGYQCLQKSTCSERQERWGSTSGGRGIQRDKVLEVWKQEFLSIERDLKT